MTPIEITDEMIEEITDHLAQSFEDELQLAVEWLDSTWEEA